MALKINAFNTQDLFLFSISGFIFLLFISNCNIYFILSHFNDILEVSLLLIMNPETTDS